MPLASTPLASSTRRILQSLGQAAPPGHGCTPAPAALLTHRPLTPSAPYRPRLHHHVARAGQHYPGPSPGAHLAPLQQFLSAWEEERGGGRILMNRPGGLHEREARVSVWERQGGLDTALALHSAPGGSSGAAQMLG